MKSKIIHHSIVALSVVVSLCSLAFMYLLLTDRPPVYYVNIPFPVAEKREYAPGESLRFVVSRCVSRPTSFTLVRVFVSDDPQAPVQEVNMASQQVAASEAVCQTVLGVPVVIPSDLPSGSWHVEHDIFEHGRFRSFDVQAESQSFEVRNPSPDPVPVLKTAPYVPPSDETVITTSTVTAPSKKEEKPKEKAQEKKEADQKPADTSNDEAIPLLPSVEKALPILNKIL